MIATIFSVIDTSFFVCRCELFEIENHREEILRRLSPAITVGKNRKVLFIMMMIAANASNAATVQS